MANAHLLIVEDEPNLRELMLDILAEEPCELEAVGGIAEAKESLARRTPDVLVLDIKLPDGDGLELLDSLKPAEHRPETIIVTAFGTVDRAAHAMRSGACDFLVKPFDEAAFRASVRRAQARAEELHEVGLRAGRVEEGSELSQFLVGASDGLRDVVALLQRVAVVDATVLVTGASGTGKELIARAIHRASLRKDGPFVSINCSAIAPQLIESELFGFERGAFTGANARRIGLIETGNGGTLFLDEIGDMPLDAQAKLLRVLQEREIMRVGGREAVPVDVRVIAATHQDLPAMVAQKTFREDLLYRLNVVPIVLPPLCERASDIPALVEHFLQKHADRHGASAPRMDDETLAKLCACSWPGNVRELENYVERAVILGAFGPVATPNPAVPLVRPPERAVSEHPPDLSLRDANGGLKTLKRFSAEAERLLILETLEVTSGNKAEAARLLGVSYKTLFNKINDYGIKKSLGFR